MSAEMIEAEFKRRPIERSARARFIAATTLGVMLVVLFISPSGLDASAQAQQAARNPVETVRAAAPLQTSGVVVDQILTLVNNDIITRTDLLWNLALDAKAPSPVGPVGSDLLQRSLDVLVDQRLVAQEAARVPAAAVTQEEINRRRTTLIATFSSEAVFRQRVESVGLTPQKIDDLIREMILIERFVDFRFRSFVFVTEQEIKRYYDETLVPEIRRAGQVPPPLEQVREQINPILKQVKIDQELDAWLLATRQRADIVHLAEP